MGKIFIGMFSGIFIGAVIYELLNSTNPEFLKKVGDMTNKKLDELCSPSGIVNKSDETI